MLPNFTVGTRSSRLLSFRSQQTLCSQFFLVLNCNDDFLFTFGRIVNLRALSNSSLIYFSLPPYTFDEDTDQFNCASGYCIVQVLQYLTGCFQVRRQRCCSGLHNFFCCLCAFSFDRLGVSHLVLVCFCLEALDPMYSSLEIICAFLVLSCVKTEPMNYSGS